MSGDKVRFVFALTRVQITGGALILLMFRKLEMTEYEFIFLSCIDSSAVSRRRLDTVIFQNLACESRRVQMIILFSLDTSADHRQRRQILFLEFYT